MITRLFAYCRLPFTGLLAAWTLLFSQVGYAQIRSESAFESEVESERIDDPYLPNAFGNQRVTPAYKYALSSKVTNTSITTVQVNVNANNQNIVGDAANEPSIAINPLNPNQIVIGWRQFDNIASNFRQAGYGYSTDAGQSWTFPGVFQPGVFRSDPVLDQDNTGQILVNSLKMDSAGIFSCDLFRSTTGGSTWSSPVDMSGGDKSWMAVDRTGGPGEGNIYASWTPGTGTCYPGGLSRSVDGGQTFQYCYTLSADISWPAMTVGIDGHVLVAGYGGSQQELVLVQSPNANQPSTPMAWYAPVNVFMRGGLGMGMPVNPAGLVGQANLDVDRSGGPGHGNIYLMATVVRQASGATPYSDAMIVRSTDGGFSWGGPTMLNDDGPGVNATQWFGTMSVAPNGRIDVVWLDNRDAGSSSAISALYYTYSVDGGDSWSPNEKLSDGFDPSIGYPNQSKMGDYFDLISEDTGAHLAWANTLNGGHDVYYSHIVPGTNVAMDASAEASHIKISPNPCSGPLTVSGCPQGAQVYVRNLLGVRVADARALDARVAMDLSAQPAGVYLVEVRLPNGRHEVQKVVKQ